MPHKLRKLHQVWRDQNLHPEAFQFPRLRGEAGQPTRAETVRQWVDDVWNQSFGATAQAILKTKPFEFSAAGLSNIDMDALRAEAGQTVLVAMEREGFDLSTEEGQQRALAVLFGYLNQAQQAAMKIEFYVWTTQHDARVREAHAERDGKIFRWDDPPEGGHPSQDFGCRCYARALGVEGYWALVSEGVDAFTADIGRWEGNVDHMYLDDQGNVTVGKGKLLSNAEGAMALPFRDRATGNRASADEISTEFDLIDAMEGSKKRLASYYAPFTHLYLPQSDIDRMVIDHMRRDFEDLLQQYADFGNLPVSAQIALWDMIYNLGPGGLEDFRLLRQAIRDGDWAEAARQSHREGPSEERNRFVFNLFMDAAEDP